MSKTYVRTWTALVRINTGPPTWWKPDLGFSRTKTVTHVRAGWLRFCIQIGVGTQRHPEEE